MSNYNNGVNDAMMGMAIADLSIGVGNSVAAGISNKKQRTLIDQIREKDEVIQELKEANDINVTNGLKWKERALETEKDLETAAETLKLVRNQSKNRLVTLMKRTGDLNKDKAMATALREGIDELFEEGHVDYDKNQFDHEVNEDYIQKRLELDKATKEDFKRYGSGGEGWLPDEDYLNNDFQEFK